jgi:hypothetical protein
VCIAFAAIPGNMDNILRILNFWRSGPLHRKKSSRSYLSTKDHGLHNLQLCRACNSLSLELITQASAHVHLKNCFELVKTSKRCRLCAFIAQTLLQNQTRSLRSWIYAHDISPHLNWPLCLALRNGCLQITLGESVGKAELEIFSDSGTVHRRASPIQS